MNTKLFVITSFFLFFSFLSFAQTQKKSKLIGGNGYVSNSFPNNKSDDRSLNISLNPNLGYFISDNLCLGIQLPLSYSHYKDISQFAPTPLKSSILGLGISPFIRYYTGLSKLKFFGEAKVGYSTSEIFYSGHKSDNHNYDNLSASIGPGISYFINEYVGIEGLVSLNYNRSSEAYSYLNQSREKFSLNCVIGLQFYLPSKR